jgi:D-3-phosphoglycerate dehydrogenase / 2-oxoglutarate reductase
MSRKVLIATDKPFAKAAVDNIRKVVEDAGYELVLLEGYTEKSQLLEAVVDVDAMIIRSDIVDAAVLDAAKRLKIVVRAGAGYDNIDLAAATAHDVVAMNTPGQNSNAVAELVIGMMIYLARAKFSGKSGSELKDKKIGLHAYGYVGKNVARIAHGLGMEVGALDPFIDQTLIAADGVKPISAIEELYSKYDYVSLHIPLVPATRGLVGYDLAMKMKKNATLVNTARKEVIDEEGLLKAFEERPDLKYVADVEPDRKAEFIEKYADRVFFTPKKMGAQTSEANNNAGIAAAHQIVAFLEKGDITFKVNK